MAENINDALFSEEKIPDGEIISYRDTENLPCWQVGIGDVVGVATEDERGTFSWGVFKEAEHPYPWAGLRYSGTCTELSVALAEMVVAASLYAVEE